MPKQCVYGEWISVDERLPPSEQGHFLVACRWNGDPGKMANRKDWVRTHYWDGTRFLVTDDYSVTHWMPMPEPPEPSVDWIREMTNDIAGLHDFTQALEQRITKLERDAAIMKSSLGVVRITAVIPGFV